MMVESKVLKWVGQRVVRKVAMSVDLLGPLWAENLETKMVERMASPSAAKRGQRTGELTADPTVERTVALKDMRKGRLKALNWVD